MPRDKKTTDSWRVHRTCQTLSLSDYVPGCQSPRYFRNTTTSQRRTNSAPLPIAWTATDVNNAHPSPDTRMGGLLRFFRRGEQGRGEAREGHHLNLPEAQGQAATPQLAVPVAADLLRLELVRGLELGLPLPPWPLVDVVAAVLVPVTTDCLRARLRVIGASSWHACGVSCPSVPDPPSLSPSSAPSASPSPLTGMPPCPPPRDPRAPALLPPSPSPGPPPGVPLFTSALSPGLVAICSNKQMKKKRSRGRT